MGTVDDCHMKENKLLGAFHKRRVNHKLKRPPACRVRNGPPARSRESARSRRPSSGPSDVVAVTLPERVPVCTDLCCVFSQV